MQPKSFLSAIALSFTLLPDLGSAIIYRAFSDTNSCWNDRPHFWTQDNGWRCTRIPDAYGYSADFDTLPNFGKGQGYSDDGCIWWEFEVHGPGYRCWRGAGRRIGSFNWWITGSRLQPALNTTDQGCAEPSGFVYKDAEGVLRNITVPAGVANASDAIAQLYEERNFEALAAYETA